MSTSAVVCLTVLFKLTATYMIRESVTNRPILTRSHLLLVGMQQYCADFDAECCENIPSTEFRLVINDFVLEICRHRYVLPILYLFKLL